MRPLAFHHLALKAKDPLGLANFYREVLGLVELKRHEDERGLRSVWLALGEGILMVERAETPGPPPVPEQDPPGLHVLAFKIGADEHAAWRAHLAAHGVPLVKETRYTAYFIDPEHNRIGLSSWPEPAP